MSTTSDDLIERIARLIYDADALRPRLTWERLTPLTQGEYRKEARAALSAFPLAEASRLSELERENARMRAALANSRDAIDFYEKVQAASQDEKAAVGQDHWNWLIEAARRARAALAGSGEK
jgi:Mg2+ and Co2+ transporter CorA